MKIHFKNAHKDEAIAQIDSVVAPPDDSVILLGGKSYRVKGSVYLVSGDSLMANVYLEGGV